MFHLEYEMDKYQYMHVKVIIIMADNNPFRYVTYILFGISYE